jgi:hypothetical protein
MSVATVAACAAGNDWRHAPRCATRWTHSASAMVHNAIVDPMDHRQGLRWRSRHIDGADLVSATNRALWVALYMQGRSHRHTELLQPRRLGCLRGRHGNALLRGAGVAADEPTMAICWPELVLVSSSSCSTGHRFPWGYILSPADCRSVHRMVCSETEAP